VTYHGQSLLLDECLGNGFAILARKSAISKAITELDDTHFLKKYGQWIAFDTYEDENTLGDHTARLRTYFDKHKVDFMLIRPDRYIFDGGKISEFPEIIRDFEKRMPLSRSEYSAKLTLSNSI
ncbi:MAG: hypothetical protein AAF696_30370, partial [Bacteroidota bacterium]